MSAPRRITDDQIAWAKAQLEKRVEAERVYRMCASLDQIAKALGCAPRYLRKILDGRARKMERA